MGETTLIEEVEEASGEEVADGGVEKISGGETVGVSKSSGKS
ncbi:MAG: hypothetical protein UW42_C0031G0006 [Candidatus Collierbacteria bacterium GW2011_GWB1_44_197]|nr:MAG: hypothetical protein UW42_C0031G0006 [Candidatus Collierbacteria bacterium GW2011_GWB1_44_197]